jgi:hypothetical protein
VRVLFAGATGVLRVTLPHLRGHDVVGLTRSPKTVELQRGFGVESALCDVFDYDDLCA